MIDFMSNLRKHLDRKLAKPAFLHAEVMPQDEAEGIELAALYAHRGWINMAEQERIKAGYGEDS